MNKDQLKKIVGHQVRLRPVTKRFSGDQELDELDDDWRVDSITDIAIQLSNCRTGHVATLGLDHIHSYLSDPARHIGGMQRGFLQLRVQLSLRGPELAIEPLPPGQWDQSGSRDTHFQKDRRDEEPVHFPTLNDPELQRVVAHLRKVGEEPCFPLMEERDTKLLRGFRIARYPGTNREIWAGYHRERYEHLLMLKPRGPAE
jgi:hypothetical protein